MIKNPQKKQIEPSVKSGENKLPAKASFLDQFQRITALDKILFTQHLGMMLRGGGVAFSGLRYFSVAGKKEAF